MGKVPVGSIPVSEAFHRYYEHLHADALSVDGLSQRENVHRSTMAAREFVKVWAGGKLEARAYDGSRELTVRPEQWEEPCLLARTFFGGPIEDFQDGELAAYRGLYLYTDKAVFEQWLAEVALESKKIRKNAGRTKCTKWLVDLIQSAPPKKAKEHYLEIAKKEFGVSAHGFLHSIWPRAIAQTGQAGKAWSKPGRRPKS
jgi:hypothetical protein